MTKIHLCRNLVRNFSTIIHYGKIAQLIFSPKRRLAEHIPIRSSTKLRFFFLMFRLQARDSNRMYHGFNNRPRGGQKSCPEGRLCYPPGGSHQCLDLPQCQGHARRQCQRWSYTILFSNPREFLMLSFRHRVLRNMCYQSYYRCSVCRYQMFANS